MSLVFVTGSFPETLDFSIFERQRGPHDSEICRDPFTLTTPKVGYIRDGDQIFQIPARALKMVQIVRNTQLKIYPSALHEIAQAQMEMFNTDVFGIIQG